MKLQKYFERLGEKVRKNNKRKKMGIARATRLDPIGRAFPRESIDIVNPAYNNSSNTNDCILPSDEMDRFEEIIGYYDIKRLFGMAISADEPVHILLVGPPASAKTVFMKSLMKLPSSYFTDGTNSTKAGMIDYIFEHKPKYILIDEIDKMQNRDQAFLLNLMETGIVSETKYQRTRNAQAKTWIFATSNDTSNLIPALRSRFFTMKLEPYTYQQFCEITQRLLGPSGIGPEIARATANAVWHDIRSGNIRDCIRIARMAKSIEDINFIVNTYLKYQT
jgi:replication-associated recombination protein RarA